MTHPKDLRARRLALGLSPAEVSRLLGLPPGTISLWERGEAPIENPDEVFARLDALGSTLRDPNAEA